MDYSDATPLAIQGNSSVIAVEHKAQIEALVDTAHKYPRSIKKFEEEALSMATTDQDTAAMMFYAVPRGGKIIEGPSARLAEIVAVAWGNMRYGASVVDISDTQITCRGYAFDMEKNVANESEVKVRITDKNGKRYNDDMITVAGNAGCSKARRNAVLTVIPRAYVDKIKNKAKEVAIGKALSLETQRATAFDYIKKMGVPEERILAVIGKPSIKDVTVDDIVLLRGLATAVKDGESTVEDAFPAIVDPEDTETSTTKPSPKGAAAKAKEKLASKPQESAQETPPVVPAIASKQWYEISDKWAQTQKDAYDIAFNKAKADGLSDDNANVNAWIHASELLV